jgi:hypothetical protein
MAYDELIRSDQDSDNDDEDETCISLNLKSFHSMCSLERLLRTFWKTQGHWYLSRRTFGHYPIIKDRLQIWLRDLKSMSETCTDATYRDQIQAYF